MSQPVTVDTAAAAPLTCTRDPSHGWRLSAVRRLALPHARSPPRQPSIAAVAPPLHHNIIRWICVVDLSDCATMPVRPVLPSQPARCFVLADVDFVTVSNLTLVTAASHISLVVMLLFWEDYALVTHALPSQHTNMGPARVPSCHVSVRTNRAKHHTVSVMQSSASGLDPSN